MRLSEIPERFRQHLQLAVISTGSQISFFIDFLGISVQEKTGISVGTIDRPSLANSRLFPVFALAFVATGTYVAYRIYYLPILKNLGLWLAGCLVVFWFSASGGMHNIIRGVPLVMPDGKTGKVGHLSSRCSQGS